MGEDVETYWDGKSWRNRIGSRPPLPGAHDDARAAAAEGAAEARVRGVVHVIRHADGRVAERRRYPRTSAELPG